MISNQILQNTIEGMQTIARADFSVIDAEGKAIASTLEDSGYLESAVVEFAKSPADSQEVAGNQFFKV